MRPTLEEAKRLACTGAYKRAAKMYAALGMPEEAAYYLAQSKIKRS